MEIIEYIKQIASCITAVSALVILFVKPLREKILGFGAIKEGQKCLLRADILRTYYKCKDTKIIHQYEFENLDKEIKAYCALKGNSFIKKIEEEKNLWEVVP